MNKQPAYIAFADESSQSAAETFTVCGLTAIEITSARKITEELAGIRKTFGYFPSDPLKWTFPEAWSRERDAKRHTQAKAAVMEICKNPSVNFFGYVHFNPTKEHLDSVRNVQFGLNTLLSAFDRWLDAKNAFAFVMFDRMDWQGSYEFCAEKFTKGLTFPANFERADQPLSNILSYSMGASRMSDLCSLNDVYTGALNYIANGKNAETIRSELARYLRHALSCGPDGKYSETSFFQRPKGKAKLNEHQASQYRELKAFLNSAVQAES